MDLAKHQGTLADWLATQSGLVAELARDEPAGHHPVHRGHQGVGDTHR